MNLQDCVGNELHREGKWGIQPFLKIDNIRIILPVSEDEMSHSQITTCENISEGAAYSPCVSLCHATQIALIAYVDSTAGYRLSIDYKHGLAVHCISATRANMDEAEVHPDPQMLIRYRYSIIFTNKNKLDHVIGGRGSRQSGHSSFSAIHRRKHDIWNE